MARRTALNGFLGTACRVVPLIVFGACCAPAMPTANAAEPGFECMVNPNLKLRLAAPLAGVLQDVTVDRGSVVHRGQLVAQLDASVDRASLALDEARTQLDAVIAGRQARIDYLVRKRTSLAALVAKGDTAQTQLDEVVAELEVARGDLAESLKEQELARLESVKQAQVVRQHSVFSPIDGVVVERTLYDGEYAYEQSPILTVAQIDPLKVEVYLPTSLYGSVKPGMTATVQPEVPGAGRYTATVEVIDNVFDAQSGTFGIRLNLPNPGDRLPAGLRCHVTFAGVQSP